MCKTLDPQGLLIMALKEKKVAQMAASFIQKQGEKMEILKLMKLLYLADRESIGSYGHPISYDKMVSMPHGPALSQTLDLAHGFIDSVPGGWDDLISDLEGHMVSLVSEEMNFDELSEADMKVLDSIWKSFGGMTALEIRNWTHENCGEYTDPEGSSLPIEIEVVLREVGISENEIPELTEEINSQHKIEMIFASL